MPIKDRLLLRSAFPACIVAGLLSVAIGCNATIARPNIFGPGTAERQQTRALYFDPYPDQEAGPKVEGGRPQGYEKPWTEPVRAQQWQVHPYSRSQLVPQNNILPNNSPYIFPSPSAQETPPPLYQQPVQPAYPQQNIRPSFPPLGVQ